MIDNSLKELVDNTFESSEQFQKYFDQSRKIVNFIQIENQIGPATNEAVENNFMCSDFKTEMDIVRIITEMSNISSRINSRINEHNITYPSKPIKKVDAMVFESLTDVMRIFKTDEEGVVTDIEDTEKKVS